MASPQHMVIFGGSARAAAFSALRAGLRPWCADLFADADLKACCPAIRVPSADYPDAFEAISDTAPPGPWMYTGGMENHPGLVARISASRSLWGNTAEGLSRARSPVSLAKIFRASGIPFPALRETSNDLPPARRWLVKPWRGAGGRGIHFLNSTDVLTPSGKQTYLQEFIEGLSCSAVFVGYEKSALLLGATRQLVGESWLHAAPFHYCGSAGPLRLEPAVRQALERIGSIFTKECHLRGLFGVDFILSEGIPWPVEVNPRYPASIEILEYALEMKALAFHRAAFDAGERLHQPPRASQSMLGKAILFASSPVTFPNDGPWTSTLARPKSLQEMPDFADIPSPGRNIKAGQPILTFFNRSTSLEECLINLKQMARDLDHRLFTR